MLGRPVAVLPPPAVHHSGREIINFTLGDPGKVDPRNFSTPAHIQAAMANGYKGEYFPPKGYGPLVDIIKEKEAGTDHVVVTNGGSEGMEKLIQTVPGHILMPSPCFPPYLEGHEYAGKEAKVYRVDFEHGPDLQDIEGKITPNTVAILVINPNNPTGMSYSRKALEGVIEIARRHGLAIVADEVYHDLTFDRPALRIRDLTSDVPIIQLESFSKKYLMCGHRVGWLAFYNINPELADLEAALVKRCTTRLCANAPGQMGAFAAVKNGTEHIEPMIAELKIRANAMIDGVTSISDTRLITPQAGFYLWWGIRNSAFEKDTDFVKALQDQEAVYILPGSGFTRGEPECERLWFRAVFLSPVEKIQEGFERIVGFVARNS